MFQVISRALLVRAAIPTTVNALRSTTFGFILVSPRLRLTRRAIVAIRGESRIPRIPPRLRDSVVNLKLPQKVRDLRRRPLDRPNELPPHHSLAIDHIGLGE